MTAALLIVLGVFSRLTLHPHNLVPLGALALFAGAKLSWRWALLVPLAILVASDLVIDLMFYAEFERKLLDPVRLTIYGTFLLIAVIGHLARNASVWVKIGLAPVISALFFVTSNFAVWLNGMHGYPMNGVGLLECYIAAIPFYRNTLLADFVGAAVLFGADAMLRAVRSTQPSLATADAK